MAFTNHHLPNPRIGLGKEAEAKQITNDDNFYSAIFWPKVSCFLFFFKISQILMWLLWVFLKYDKTYNII